MELANWKIEGPDQIVRSIDVTCDLCGENWNATYSPFPRKGYAYAEGNYWNVECRRKGCPNVGTFDLTDLEAG